MYLSATLHLSDKVTLQRIYYTFEDVKTAGDIHHDLDVGETIVDGWITKVTVEINFSVQPTAVTPLLFYFGLKSNPTELIGQLMISGGVYQDAPFEDYLANTNDSAAFHLNSKIAPMFYILLDCVGQNYVDTPINITKYIRRPMKSADEIEFYYGTASLETAADSAGVCTVHVELENVIAPNNWN